MLNVGRWALNEYWLSHGFLRSRSRWQGLCRTLNVWRLRFRAGELFSRLGDYLRRRRASRPTRCLNAVGENSVIRFSLRMRIYGSVKFALHHVAPVACINGRLGGAGFPFLRCVPGKRAEPTSVAFTISIARPLRFIARLGMVVPDQRLAVFRALISPVAERDIREHQ